MPQHCNQECTPATFRPCELHHVRWLDWEEDFVAVNKFWFQPLSMEEWLSFRDMQYRYCAVIESASICSIAALWRYSDSAWEVAAVKTSPEHQRRGLGKSVVSFVTRAILAEGRLATCLTASENLPMQKTAQSVGFYHAPRR